MTTTQASFAAPARAAARPDEPPPSVARGSASATRLRTLSPMRIAMLAYPGVQVLDVMGPLEVFSRTSRLMVDDGLRDRPLYQVEIIAPKRGWFECSSGLRLFAEHGIADAPTGIDTLLIAGGMGTKHFRRHAAMLAWLRRQSRRVRRLASICTGAFLLAEAGLLKGRRATTHWGACDEFAHDFPDTHVEPDTIFVRDGMLYTSAGVTSGMDLALALVEEDCGRDVALAAARQLVMFLQRPGGQAQFSAQLAGQLAEHEPLRDLQAHILDHPEEDLSVGTLARRVAMSPRNFARVFTREVGQTPARFVVSARVETARRLLEETAEPLETVATRSGLANPETLRRAFLRLVGIAPGQYRERFTRSQDPARRSIGAAPSTRRMP